MEVIVVATGVAGEGACGRFAQGALRCRERCPDNLNLRISIIWEEIVCDKNGVAGTADSPTAWSDFLRGRDVVAIFTLESFFGVVYEEVVFRAYLISRLTLVLPRHAAVPVLAAGGIADGRGIAAAFALGASGVQIGSAYLRCPESTVIAPARVALAQARDDSTVITNVMTGRPARGVANRVMREVGPVSADAPAFPHAATALGPLKAAAEKLGKVDFTNLFAGQAVRLGRDMPAAELTRALAGAALARLAALGG